jgi:hypothetical protein
MSLSIFPRKSRPQKLPESLFYIIFPESRELIESLFKGDGVLTEKMV